MKVTSNLPSAAKGKAVLMVLFFGVTGLQLLTTSRLEAEMDKIEKTETQWQKELTPEQYHVLREKGTERAFTGQYYDHHAKGKYKCAGCGTELFDSQTKFESGTGWPSFWAPAKENGVQEEEDFSHGMIRMEVKCPVCGGHLGHVFDDGPKPTGKRYCINSAALQFEEKK